MEENTGKSSLKPGSRRFGSIAFYRGYVNLKQVQEALAEQVEDDIMGRPHRLLGTIFREKNWITEEQETSVLREIMRAVE